MQADDSLLDAIAALPVVQPRADHAERVRRHCQTAIGRPSRSEVASFEPVTIGTFCAMYAWQVVRIASRIPLP
jgi:hypothetical protein